MKEQWCGHLNQMMLIISVDVQLSSIPGSDITLTVGQVFYLRLL